MAGGIRQAATFTYCMSCVLLFPCLLQPLQVELVQTSQAVCSLGEEVDRLREEVNAIQVEEEGEGEEESKEVEEGILVDLSNGVQGQRIDPCCFIGNPLSSSRVVAARGIGYGNLCACCCFFFLIASSHSAFHWHCQLLCRKAETVTLTEGTFALSQILRWSQRFLLVLLWSVQTAKRFCKTSPY